MAALAELLKHREDAPSGRQLSIVLSVDSASGAAAGDGHGMAITAGGRHNNDKADFRSVKLLPTMEEAVCTAPSFLPAPHSPLEPTSAAADEAAAGHGGAARLMPGGSGPEGSPAADLAVQEAALISRQFRLLREDAIAPLRDELKLVQGALAQGKAPGGARVFKDLEIVGVSLERRASVMFSFAPPHDGWRKAKTRAKFWAEARSLLPLDGLVCIVHRGNPLCIATVTRRKPLELTRAAIDFDSEPDPESPESFLSPLAARAAYSPRIGLTFPDPSALAALLADGFPGRPLGSLTFMIQVASNFFAYSPVLKCLQGMTAVPFADELVFGRSPLPAPAFASGRTAEYLSDSAKGLDGSQREALRQALSQRVALIQGPPGTGKTYVGAALAKALHDEAPTETILCVCYTNHQLDHFLESLLDIGIVDIVRVGGRSKSARLEEYNINTGAERVSGLTPSESKRAWDLNHRLKKLSEDIARRTEFLSNARVTEDWWEHVGPFLEQFCPEVFQQLRNPARLDYSYSDGQKVVVSRTAPDHLWKMWFKGFGSEEIAARLGVRVPRGADNVWSKNLDERKALVAEWSLEMFAERREHLGSLLSEHAEADSERQALYKLSWRKQLKAARVIGCTTTGAAMHKDVLDEVKPATLLVEEAGEVLEAHVLSSLTNGTKRLIMIGDHKQLRPKVETFDLSVASGKGHDLNRSLFERLVQSGFPHVTLSTQHRMRPEISALHLHTYPGLLNDASVLAHPPLLGVSNTVAFVDHNEPEDSEYPGGRTWRDASQSRTNAHEIAMAVSTVRYLLQQGYKPRQIVVITAYLGQLLEVRKALAREAWDVDVQEQDLAALPAAASPAVLEDAGLARSGTPLPPPPTPMEDEDGAGSNPGSNIRVSTIDSFQVPFGRADLDLLSTKKYSSDFYIFF